MLTRARKTLFREPAGQPQTLVMFGGAVVLSSLAGYGYAVGGTTSVWSVAMAVGFALSGAAEALPAGRRRTAGGLRIVAIGLMLSLIGWLAFAPGYVV